MAENQALKTCKAKERKTPNTPCIGIIVAILLIVVRRTLIVVLT